MKHISTLLKLFLTVLALGARPGVALAQTNQPVRFSLISLTGQNSNQRILVTADQTPYPPVSGTNLLTGLQFYLQPVHGVVITNLVPWGYTIKVDGWPRSAHIVVTNGPGILDAVALINPNAFAPLYIYTGGITVSSIGYDYNLLSNTPTPWLINSSPKLSTSGLPPPLSLDASNRVLYGTIGNSPVPAIDWSIGRLYGTWTADFFAGDGSALTGITPSQIGAQPVSSVLTSLAAIPNAAAQTTLAITNLAGANGTLRSFTNLPSGTVTNQGLTTSFYEDGVIYNSTMPAPNTCWWIEDLKYEWMSQRGNEYYLDENNTGNFAVSVHIPVFTNTTSITISFHARSLSGSAGAPNFYLWNPVVGNIVNSQQFVNVAPTLISLTSSSTLITNCFLYFAPVSASGMAISNDVTVAYTPAPPFSILNSPFKRYEVKPENVYKNGGSQISQTETIFGTPIIPNPTINGIGTHSYVDFVTDSKSLLLEFLNPSLYAGSLYINGSFYTNLPITSTGNPFVYVPITLTTTNKTDTIRLYNATANYRCIPRAIYVPAGNSVSFNKRQNLRTVYVIADSILAGVFQFTGGNGNETFRNIETYFPFDIYSCAQPNQTLNSLWGNAAARMATVQEVSSLRPNDIWVQLGVNDWSLGNPILTYSNQLADMVDNLHEISPNTLFFLQTMTPTNAPFAAAGVPTGTYLQFSNVVLQTYLPRTNFCVLVNGYDLLLPSMLADGIHSTEAGAIYMARRIGTNLWLNTTTPTGLSPLQKAQLKKNQGIVSGLSSATSTTITFANAFEDTSYTLTAVGEAAALSGFYVSSKTTTTCVLNFSSFTGSLDWQAIRQ